MIDEAMARKPLQPGKALAANRYMKVATFTRAGMACVLCTVVPDSQFQRRQFSAQARLDLRCNHGRLSSSCAGRCLLR